MLSDVRTEDAGCCEGFVAIDALIRSLTTVNLSTKNICQIYGLPIYLSLCLSPPISLSLLVEHLPMYQSFFRAVFPDDVAKELIIFLSASLSQHQNIPNLVLYPFGRFPLGP